VFLIGTGGSRKGEMMCKMTQKLATQKSKGQTMNLGVLRSKIRCETNNRRRLWESVGKKIPELLAESWILHHDTAPTFDV
jgi:hypothetical protein